MRRGRLLVFVTAICLAGLLEPTSVSADVFDDLQEKHGYQKLHTTAEFLAIADSSEIVYIIEPIPDSMELVRGTLTVLEHPEYEHWLPDDDLPTLTQYQITESSHELLTIAEGASLAGDFESARATYELLLAQQPDFAPAYALIGDTYLSENELDSAIHYCNLGLEKNYLDFRAHWVMAIALWQKGDSAAALNHITKAHLYNRNHEGIHQDLLQLYEMSGQPWCAIDFFPQYAIYGDSLGVHVVYGDGWLGYAIAKAVWSYEPGYAETMLGYALPEGSSLTMNSLEELECLKVACEDSSIADKLLPIFDANVCDGFIAYEIFSREYPFTLLNPTDHEIVSDVLEYLERCKTGFTEPTPQ